VNHDDGYRPAAPASPELAAFVAGAVLALGGELGESVSYGGGDDGAGFTGVGGRGEEQDGDHGCGGGAGEAHGAVPLEDHVPS
jgi:hypothetical protein